MMGRPVSNAASIGRYGLPTGFARMSRRRGDFVTREGVPAGVDARSLALIGHALELRLARSFAAARAQGLELERVVGAGATESVGVPFQRGVPLRIPPACTPSPRETQTPSSSAQTARSPVPQTARSPVPPPKEPA
jgi:hypothetical protein